MSGPKAADVGVAAMLRAADTELRMSADAHSAAGIKERIASRLERLEAAAGRQMIRGTGILATIGATAPFVGLFGTVWGIMNSFIGISKSQTTNLAVVAPGIAEALAGDRARPRRRDPRRGHLQHVLALDRRLSRLACRCCRRDPADRQPRSRSRRFRSSVRPIAGARSPPSRRHERTSRPRRRRAQRSPRDQRHAVHRRDAGAADHLHGRGAAGDGRHLGRPAGLERGAQPRPDKPLFLTLKSDLTVSLGNDTINRATLAGALDRATAGDKQQRVFLRADKTVPYGELMSLMNVLRGAGYLKVALVGLEADKM